MIFGFVLSRSGAADYDQIQSMFLFRSFQLYGIPRLPWFSRPQDYGSSNSAGAPRWTALKIELKPFTRERRRRPAVRDRLVDGHVHGPILVNIGRGKIYALAARGRARRSRAARRRLPAAAKAVQVAESSAFIGLAYPTPPPDTREACA
jgi:hypothetical protein